MPKCLTRHTVLPEEHDTLSIAMLNVGGVVSLREAGLRYFLLDGRAQYRSRLPYKFCKSVKLKAT